jgi:hypothetical protein
MVIVPRFGDSVEIVAAFEQNCAVVGCPKAIRVDHGSELISGAPSQ